MTRRAFDPKGPWPHGRPTIVCPQCHGGGLDAGRAHQYLTSHVPTHDTTALDDAVRCPTCDGRGRLTVERALTLGIRGDS